MTAVRKGSRQYLVEQQNPLPKQSCKTPSSETMPSQKLAEAFWPILGFTYYKAWPSYVEVQSERPKE